MADNGSESKADTNPENRIKIIIADSQSLFRLGVISALLNESDIEVAGEAGSMEELTEKIIGIIPEVVLLDINLSSDSGPGLTKKIKRLLPTAAVVVITPDYDDDQLFEVVKSGASGYVKRSVDSDELKDVIRKAGRGEYPISDKLLSSPDAARRVLHQFQQFAQGREIESLISPLTPREIEILDYMARGSSNKQIASQLDVSEQTVKNQITSIFRKLDANARTEAVWKALERGIISFKMYPSLKVNKE